MDHRMILTPAEISRLRADLEAHPDSTVQVACAEVGRTLLRCTGVGLQGASDHIARTTSAKNQTKLLLDGLAGLIREFTDRTCSSRPAESGGPARATGSGVGGPRQAVAPLRNVVKLVLSSGGQQRRDSNFTDLAALRPLVLACFCRVAVLARMPHVLEQDGILLNTQLLLNTHRASSVVPSSSSEPSDRQACFDFFFFAAIAALQLRRFDRAELFLLHLLSNWASSLDSGVVGGAGGVGPGGGRHHSGRGAAAAHMHLTGSGGLMWNARSGGQTQAVTTVTNTADRTTSLFAPVLRSRLMRGATGGSSFAVNRSSSCNRQQRQEGDQNVKNEHQANYDGAGAAGSSAPAATASTSLGQTNSVATTGSLLGSVMSLFGDGNQDGMGEQQPPADMIDLDGINDDAGGLAPPRRGGIMLQPGGGGAAGGGSGPGPGGFGARTLETVPENQHAMKLVLLYFTLLQYGTKCSDCLATEQLPFAAENREHNFFLQTGANGQQLVATTGSTPKLLWVRNRIKTSQYLKDLEELFRYPWECQILLLEMYQAAARNLLYMVAPARKSNASASCAPANSNKILTFTKVCDEVLRVLIRKTVCMSRMQVVQKIGRTYLSCSLRETLARKQATLLGGEGVGVQVLGVDEDSALLSGAGAGGVSIICDEEDKMFDDALLAADAAEARAGRAGRGGAVEAGSTGSPPGRAGTAGVAATSSTGGGRIRENTLTGAGGGGAAGMNKAEIQISSDLQGGIFPGAVGAGVFATGGLSQELLSALRPPVAKASLSHEANEDQACFVSALSEDNEDSLNSPKNTNANAGAAAPTSEEVDVAMNYELPAGSADQLVVEPGDTPEDQDQDGDYNMVGMMGADADPEDMDLLEEDAIMLEDEAEGEGLERIRTKNESTAENHNAFSGRTPDQHSPSAEGVGAGSQLRAGKRVRDADPALDPRMAAQTARRRKFGSPPAKAANVGAPKRTRYLDGGNSNSNFARGAAPGGLAVGERDRGAAASSSNGALTAGMNIESASTLGMGGDATSGAGNTSGEGRNRLNPYGQSCGPSFLSRERAAAVLPSVDEAKFHRQAESLLLQMTISGAMPQLRVQRVGIDFVRLSRVLNLPTADQDLQMRHERKRLMVLTKALQQELLQRRSQLEKKKPQGAGKQQEKKDRSRGAGGGAGFS